MTVCAFAKWRLLVDVWQASRGIGRQICRAADWKVQTPWTFCLLCVCDSCFWLLNFFYLFFWQDVTERLVPDSWCRIEVAFLTLFQPAAIESAVGLLAWPSRILLCRWREGSETGIFALTDCSPRHLCIVVLALYAEHAGTPLHGQFAMPMCKLYMTCCDRERCTLKYRHEQHSPQFSRRSIVDEMKAICCAQMHCIELTRVRLSSLIVLYFHPLYIMVIKILSSIHVSSALIILYISYSIATINNGSTCHPLKVLSKYIHVRSYFDGFIKTNSMV
jgi:hypothetical protein